MFEEWGDRWWWGGDFEFELNQGVVGKLIRRVLRRVGVLRSLPGAPPKKVNFALSSRLWCHCHSSFEH